ncbi:MAG: calcium-binding protein, partial [Leifsonia flava]
MTPPLARPRATRARFAAIASVIAACVIALVSVGVGGGPGVGPSAGAGASTTDAAPSASPSAPLTATPAPSATLTPPVSPAPAATPTPTVTPTPAPALSGTALAALETLPIKGRAPKTGYDRDGGFGTAWKDVDRNGCDTRNDVLARDLTEIAKSGNCRVMTGRLVSPYTGATIDFVRGQDTSALVQIDHLVALSNAWQTGAQQLT